MTTERDPETCVATVEINVFVRSPEGFDGHVKIAGLPASKFVDRLATTTQALAAAGFTASERHTSPSPSRERGPGGEVSPRCPEHPNRKPKPSQHVPDGLYCTAKVGDGYCKWSYDPAKPMRAVS